MNLKEADIPAKLFITGIDTDAGKSFATGTLARFLLENGKRVITQKFVQTGNTGISEDIVVHRKIMGIPLTTADKSQITAPVIFSYPASPDLAARIDGKELELSVIDRATETLAKSYEYILIEGAGGLMVPLKGAYLTIDYIRDRKLPVVLVTNGRLGSINHTLLSLYALRKENIPLFAVMYNSFFDKDKVICKDTREYIQHTLSTDFPEALFLEF